MAKIIVHTLDMDGHVGPAIPMVRKLIECNHQVTWITGRKYENRIKATGATFRPRVKGIDPGNIAHTTVAATRAASGLRWKQLIGIRISCW